MRSKWVILLIYLKDIPITAKTGFAQPASPVKLSYAAGFVKHSYWW